MRESLETFLASIPNSTAILAKHSDAVALFGFFLSEVLGRAVTPSALTECYAASHLPVPKNLSDTIGKSGAFVRDKNKWALHRDTILRFKSVVPTPRAVTNDIDDDERKNTVMVVYGRDEATRLDMFSFLRSLHLQPIEWNTAVQRTGKTSPYVGEVVSAAFSMAQAFLVLMTPDEKAVLRPELQKKLHDAQEAFQPRPNVILEAGMALATDDARTILVSTGQLRGMSDLDGRHLISLDNSPERRNDLIQRLTIAGCNPKMNGTDWINIGNFERFS